MAVLGALAALPKIAAYVEQFAAACALWWISRQKTETLAEIADAAALTARAQTQEDRYAAIEKWREALSRPRVTRG